MPRKRKREPKPHKFINNIEHKQCGGSCKKWKPLDKFGKKNKRWDKLYYSCKDCRKNKFNPHKKLIEDKRKKARLDAPTGYSVCLYIHCTVNEWLQPLDQFDSASVHRDTLTSTCLTCRTKNKVSINNSDTMKACKKVWDEWRKAHPCLECSKDPKHVHNYLLIEADHLPEFGKKVKACSNLYYWQKKSRGVPALKAELKKCQALCRFHHRLKTHKRRHDKGQILKAVGRLRRRKVINAEKCRRGFCSNPKCNRILKKGEECGFTFDHRDPTTKFKRNGKFVHPSTFVHLPQALFDIQWPLEQAKCDLLCANCDKLKTCASRDGFKT